GSRREPEDPHEEAIRQRLEDGAVRGAELLTDELAARLARPVGNLHALRVVQQQRHHVLLIDGGPDDERRTEEAEEDQPERGYPQGCQDDPVAQAAFGDPDAAVGIDGENDSDRRQRRGDERTGTEVEPEFSLLEYDWPIRKERLENPLEHR